MNAVLLGAFSEKTGEITFQSIEKAIMKQFPGEVGRQNVEMARKAYEFCHKSNS
jgi:Pyruvate/2-oxoacid:ferredoxin oxidoreductase gamma subunit